MHDLSCSGGDDVPDAIGCPLAGGQEDGAPVRSDRRAVGAGRKCALPDDPVSDQVV